MCLITFFVSYFKEVATALVFILIIDLILWKCVIKQLFNSYRQPMLYEETNVNQISSSNNDHSTYKVRKGTVNKGETYETVFIANVVLKLVLDNEIEDFSIYSNAEDFLPFDDLVIEIKTIQGFKECIAIQLKHKDGSLSLDSLKGKKGKFSIKKLFEKVQNKKHLDGFKLILLTNYPLNCCNKSFALEDEKFKITMKRCNSEKFLQNGDSYEFEVDEIASDDYRKFFNQFFLYSGQLNVAEVENTLLQQFQQEFDCEKSVFWEYFNFFTKWSMKEGKRNKLSKTWMKEMIALHLLSPLVHPISSDSQANKKTDILRNSINNFNITIFEERDTKNITDLWSMKGMKKVLNKEDVQTINKLSTDYQIIPYIENWDALKNNEFSIAAWFLDKCPLIIKYKKCVTKAIKFMKRKKFVLLYDSIDQDFKNSFPEFEIFQNLANLKKKLSLYEELVKTFHCSLQGKAKISLETLIGKNQSFEKQITTNDLILFLSDDLTIGEKEILPDIYIERYFSRPFINYEFLLTDHKNTVIIISNYNKDNTYFKQFQMIEVEILLKQDFKNENTDERKKLYFCKNDCSQEIFETVCTKLKGKSKYHHFRVNGERLEWIYSRGGIEDLRQFQTEQMSIEEKELYNCYNSIIIICGDPGLGKTTSIKYLKNSTYPSLWTILIYPKDHFNFFSKNQENVNDFQLYLLLEANKKFPRFDFKVFQNLLKIGRVNFIWDGLDEIYEKNLNVVQNYIEKFSKNGLKQCVTSRNNLRNKLEDRFSIIATTIRQFNEMEQKEYISKRLSCSEEELENTFTRIQNSISFFKYNDILGIPLQIYMFTELFIHDRKKYSELLTNTFLLTDLCYHFIHQKFNIYSKEKENLRDINDMTAKKNEEYRNYKMKSYQQIALQMYFSEEDVHFIDEKACQKFLTEIQDGKDSLGIITTISSNNYLPNFIHNSYGEYFAACYLFENYENIPNLSTFLFKEKYENIRFLFDLLLAKDHPAHIAVLCKNFEALEKCNSELFTSEDRGGRNPLHLACSWGDTYPPLKVTVEKNIRYIVHEEKRNPVKKPNPDHKMILRRLSVVCNPENKDQVYKLDAYSYADETLSLLCLAILSENHNVPFENLKNYGNIPLVLYYAAIFDIPIIFTKYLETVTLVYTQNGDSLLSVAAINGSLASCDQLLIKHKININETNRFNDTPLYKACVSGSGDIINLLIKNGANVNAGIENGYTPLLAAASMGHTEIVKLLIDKKATINAKIERDNTPLHAASSGGHLETVKLLIDSGANVNAGWSFTPLYVAATNGHEEIVKSLMKSGAQVNAANDFGHSPLYTACRNGHIEIVKLLVNNGALVNAGIENGFIPLYAASENGHVEIVKLLIHNGAKINIVNRLTNETPLQTAFRNGHSEITKLLIDKETRNS